MFKIFRYVFSFVMLFLAVNYNHAQSDSGTWCPQESCEICDQEITQNESSVTSDGGTICFKGNFEFTGEINTQNDSTGVGTTICIEEGVTINRNNLNGLNGNWTIYNYGTIELSNKFTIGSSQSFYNYGTLLMTGSQNELTIEEGGLYCNSGETFLAGDLINWGQLFSSGFFDIEDEFKNKITGEAWIAQMSVEDEISNEGTIYLKGYIESRDASFKNFEGAEVIGLEHPCNAIRAKTDIENQGLIDGSGGPIGLGVDEADYNATEGTNGVLIQDIFFRDTEGLEGINEDCFRLLPVEWAELKLDFSADDRTVTVHWATLKEWDNSHFEVQRADRDVEEWENIGTLDGVGFSDSRTAYSFTDINLPLSGGDLYYRIRQVDLDGKSSFSKTLLVNIPDTFHVKGIWRVYPNPTIDGQMKIGLLERSGYEGESLTFRLIHPFAVTEFMTVENEDEMNEILATWGPKIPKGLFVVEIRWGHNVEHIKVLRK